MATATPSDDLRQIATESMNGLLSAGVLALAYVAGRWALCGSLAPALRRSILAGHALGLVLGIALLTPPLVVLAAAGQFRLSWLGTLGWIVAIAMVPLLVSRSRESHTRLRFDAADIIVLAAAVIFAVIAAAGRDETLGAGRDQQVYAEAAVALAERGTPFVTFAPLDDADRTLLSTISGVQIPDVTDGHAGIDRPITLRHPLGWPIWLALAHATFGIQSLYAANSIVFALAGLLFFLLLRLVVRPAIAVAATILLFALPSSVWIAGISLSEPLAMMLLLAVPLLGASGLYRSCWQIVALLVAATLTRLDSSLAVPAVMGAAMLSLCFAMGRGGARVVRRFVLAQFLGLAAALLLYRAFFPDYLRITLQYAAIVTAVSLALTIAVLLLTPAAVTSLRKAIDSRLTRLAAVAIVAGLFLYAVAIRPNLQPFGIVRQGSGLDGTRDFREDSVLNLATYLSWPILLAAFGGACYVLWQRWATRSGPLRPFVLALGLGPALLYLWFPFVSPDHPWAFRRFVPTIVPFAVLFASILVHALTRRIGRAGAAVGALAMVAPYALIASEFPPSRLPVHENAGMTKEIAGIAEKLPGTLVVSYGVDENVAAALLIAFGKPVVFVKGDLAAPDDADKVNKWVETKLRSGRPVWFLHGPELWRTGAKMSQRRDWWLTSRYVVRTDRPPATELATRQSQVILSEIRNFDPSFATRMFGGERIWGTRESGFLEMEIASFGMFRWTDGVARIDLPSKALIDAEELKLDVLSDDRPGERRWLHVLMDGHLLWTGSVGPGITTLRIPMRTIPAAEAVARLELLSEVKTQTEKVAANDLAVHGVGLLGIRPIRAGESSPNEPGMRGFRSGLEFVGLSPGLRQIASGGAGNFVLDIQNTGDEYWPTVRELGGPVGAVQIALRWHRRHQAGAFVGDNRWPLSVSLLPGDRTRVRVPLVPVGLDGRPLPPGEYEVDVGMVRETVAMFSDNGDAVLSMPVVVTP